MIDPLWAMELQLQEKRVVVIGYPFLILGVVPAGES
jgi:hypothetical protein